MPLDDRPCTSLFPQRLAAVAGIELVSPPAEYLGHFLKPGDSSALARWLLREVPRCEAAIVSADMLAYGGLVASRRVLRSSKEAEDLISTLSLAKRENPRLVIYANSVIMRLSITSSNQVSHRHWELVHRYSRLADEAEATGYPQKQRELAEVTAEIPADVLTEYLQARERNHRVNRLMIELASTGVLDFLLLAQEDASRFGLHRREQRALRELAESLGVGDRVLMVAGTDEAAMVLVARYLNFRKGRGPSFYPVFSSEKGPEIIAPFEDRPIRETVRGQIQATGGRMADSENEADILLFVNTPGLAPGDHCDHPYPEDRHGVCSGRDLEPFVSEIARQQKLGRMVALADVAYANGADPDFLELLNSRADLTGLAAYAGWNTAGNTTGTAVAQATAWWHLCTAAGGSPEETGRAAAHLSFLLERLVDDWCYQVLVRPAVTRWLGERGWSPWNLAEAGPGVLEKVEEEVRNRLIPMAKELFGRWLRGRRTKVGGPGGTGGSFPIEVQVAGLRQLSVSLPWPRVFEVDIQAEVEVRSL